MVKEMEQSRSGAGARGSTVEQVELPRIPDGTQTCVCFPARDFQPLFITGTAKEAWT